MKIYDTLLEKNKMLQEKKVYKVTQETKFIREIILQSSISKLAGFNFKWSLTSRAPEREIFSDPAKSTRLSLPHLISSSSPIAASFMCTVMENTEWDRL